MTEQPHQIGSNGTRYLIVTIDTEIDQDPHWRIANPPTFSSVVDGIPRVLSPLFERYGVVPTYLLSPEVIEEPACVRMLRCLPGRIELGTHLHVDFIEPERRLFRHNMGGCRAAAVQKHCSANIEKQKLENLTKAFVAAFGFGPTAFRCGRYGMSDATLGILAELGYQIDSSVTPGLFWKYDGEVVDFRGWSQQPVWVKTAGGSILELPLSIRPASWLSPILRDLPMFPQRAMANRLLEQIAGYRWLRPSWSSGKELVRYVQEDSESFLVLMLHSTEVIAGASPYAISSKGVRRIVEAMRTLFSFWTDAGYSFCSMTDAVRLVRTSGSEVYEDAFEHPPQTSSAVHAS